MANWLQRTGSPLMDALRAFLVAGNVALTETINHVWFAGNVSNHDGLQSIAKA